MSDQYAVIGNPIAHSKSPWIHSSFAKQLGESVEYNLLSADTDAFSAAIRAFTATGGKGLNVTVPFKQEAWAAADELSDHARKAGAVNTLSFLDNGRIRGDNTDGVGLVRDLIENQSVTLKGRRILMMGAGGAVRGVLQPLLEQSPTEIYIVNRTVERAEELAMLFAELGQITAGSYADLTEQGAFDVIINGSSSSLGGELPPLPASIVAPGCHAYDMMYAAEPTIFERWCTDHQVSSVSNGLGMLVEQAAESFWIWRNKRPDTAPVLKALSDSLKATA